MRVPLHHSWVGAVLGLLTLPFAIAVAWGIALIPYWAARLLGLLADWLTA